MSGLFGKAAKFAKSKQGKETLEKLQKYAKSEQGKEKIEALKDKVEDITHKDKPKDEAAAKPVAEPDPNAPPAA